MVTDPGSSTSEEPHRKGPSGPDTPLSSPGSGVEGEGVSPAWPGLRSEPGQRHAQLQLLDAVAQALSASPELQTRIERALLVLLKSLPYEAIHVLLLDWDAEQLEMYAGCWHGGQSQLSSRRLDLPKLAPPGVVPLPGLPWPLDHRRGWQPTPPLATPITSSGLTLGLLAVSLPAGRRPLPRERHLLRRIGRQIGIAVENARLHERVRREANRLVAINTVASAVRRSLRVPSLLDEALRQLLSVTDLEFGAVFLTKGETGELTIGARAGLSEAQAIELGDQVRQQSGLGIPSGGSKRTVLQEDLPGPQQGQPKGRLLAPRCLMHIPLYSLAYTFGVLSAGSSTQRHFAPGTADFLRGLGSQISLALENAYLYEQTQAGARRLAATNAELEEVNEALREATSSKNQFLANVSHELKRPLAPARLAVETLLEAAPGKLSAQRRERLLRNILHNLDDMDALVSQLLDAVRLQHQPQQATKGIIDLRAVVRASLSSVQALAEARHIEVHSILSSRALKVQGDPEALERVCTNLLSNAIKFNRDGGSVLVQLEPAAAGGAVLSVTDTGTGIPPHARQHIFESFYQADSSSTRRHGGLGLGLCVAKKIVEQHGGQIRFDSEEGVGTTFTVALPLA